MKTNNKDKLNSLISFIAQLDNDEIFKEITFIDGAENRYFVSNKGRVLSLCQNSPRILKPFICGNSGNNKGYYYITIKRKNYRVNRLVAQAFIENPLNKPIVDHIDEDKYNNNADNLQWVTQQENILKHRGITKDA